MIKKLLVLCLFVATAALTLNASTLWYNDRAAWNAATAALSKTVITFDGLAPAAGFADFSTPAGLTEAGVTFTGTSRFTPGCPLFIGCTPPSTSSNLRVADANAPGSIFFSYGWSGSAVLLGAQSSRNCGSPRDCDLTFGNIQIALPGSGVFAAGTDISTVYGGTEFVLSSGDFQGVSAGFLGFVSTTPITAASFPGASFGFQITMLDNFTIAQPTVSAVPEPATFWLLGLGSLGLLRRKPRAKAR